MKIFLSVGSNNLENLFNSIDEIEVIDSENDLETLKNLTEFIQADFLVINKLLDEKGDLVNDICRIAKGKRIKVIMLVDGYRDYKDKKYIAALVRHDVYCFLKIDELNKQVLLNAFNNYPKEFDFSILNINQTINENAAEIPIIKEIIGTVVIAVAGASRGAGCTHTAISISKFLTNKKEKVAIIELNKNRHFIALGENDEAEYFELDGIDFYANADSSKLVKVLQSDYKYVVLDLGIIRTYENGKLQKKDNFDEMMRANYKLLVTGIKDWQLESLIASLSDDSLSWKVYVTSADKKMVDLLQEQIDQELIIAPYNVDPFELDDLTRETFSKILGTVLPDNEISITDRDKQNRLKKLVRGK